MQDLGPHPGSATATLHDPGQVDAPPWASLAWLACPESKDSCFPAPPRCLSEVFVGNGDASAQIWEDFLLSDCESASRSANAQAGAGGSSPGLVRLQGGGVALSRAWAKLERLGFQPGTATVGLCNPGQVTVFLCLAWQVQMGLMRACAEGLT